MNICKPILITFVLLLGVLFLIYFFVTIRKLPSVTNVRIITLNGSKFLKWDFSDNTGGAVNFLIALNVGGFLSKRNAIKTQIPLFRCDVPVKTFDTGITVQFAIIARNNFANSPTVNGTLIT